MSNRPEPSGIETSAIGAFKFSAISFRPMLETVSVSPAAIGRKAPRARNTTNRPARICRSNAGAGCERCRFIEEFGSVLFELIRLFHWNCHAIFRRRGEGLEKSEDVRDILFFQNNTERRHRRNREVFEALREFR